MSVKPDGGSAFPTHGGNDYDDPRNKIISGGMTLRDWFAGQALAGMLANCDRDGQNSWDGVHNLAAYKAYVVADAMIAAKDAK